MILFSFYHRETGSFSGKMFASSDPDAVKINTPKDHVSIEGKYDALSQKFDLATGKVVDYQPPQPSSDHEWNANTKRWQLNAAATEKKRRRSAALANISRLETSSLRALRELALDLPGAHDRLQSIDSAIAALRKDL